MWGNTKHLEFWFLLNDISILDEIIYSAFKNEEISTLQSSLPPSSFWFNFLYYRVNSIYILFYNHGSFIYLV